MPLLLVTLGGALESIPRQREGAGIDRDTLARTKKRSSPGHLRLVIQSRVGRIFEVSGSNPLLAGVLRGNTIGGNTTRNSERKMAL